MSEDFDVCLGYYRGPLEDVLAGLEDAGLEGAVLELDGDARELSSLLDELTLGHPDLIADNRRARDGRFRVGPIVFGAARMRRLPIERGSLRRLRDLLDRHADPEIAIELNVRDAEGYLVQAPDVGDNEIWVSRRLPKPAVEALRAALGDALTPADDA